MVVHYQLWDTWSTNIIVHIETLNQANKVWGANSNLWPWVVMLPVKNKIQKWCHYPLFDSVGFLWDTSFILLKQAAHSPPTHTASSGFWCQVLPRVERTLAAGVPPLAVRCSDRRIILNRFDILAARRGKKCVLPQGVPHQATRRVFLVGVRNRLMPHELAASVLPASHYKSPNIVNWANNATRWRSQLSIQRSGAFAH
jgi:hypothetical protein